MRHLKTIEELLSLPTCMPKLLHSLEHTTNEQTLLCYETGELGLLSLELPSPLPDTGFMSILDGVILVTDISEIWTGFTVVGYVYLTRLKSLQSSHQAQYRFSQELLMEYISHTQNTTGEQSGLTKGRPLRNRFEMLDIG